MSEQITVSLPGDRPATYRRRKAGPWVPVEQGGA